LVAGHVGMDPLDVRPQLGQRRIRGLGGFAQLLALEGSNLGDVSLDDVLAHVSISLRVEATSAISALAAMLLTLAPHRYAPVISTGGGSYVRVISARLSEKLASAVGSAVCMQLQLLGGFALTDPDGRLVPVTLRRGQALVAYLALKETRSESRETLLDLLWP